MITEKSIFRRTRSFLHKVVYCFVDQFGTKTFKLLI